ncbi:MAG: helix-turn-helix transcriptional regulator [Acidimicrobiales bacterium]
MVGQLHLARAQWGPVPSGVAVRTGTFALPGGTATFLSADVDGPPRLGEPSGDEMGEATARLDAALTAAVARHRGVRQVEAGGEGSFVAAFARASEALACALDVQRELVAQGLSRTRMGVGTGEAQLRDEVRYFGQAVARAGRLRDLGHGGQVLISRASADLVAEHLPAGASLVDLGAHRMRDLGRPEQVYQLAHPELRSGFPPLRSLDRHPHNLAVQLTSFVGREAAVAEVSDLLAHYGLVTLTGSGGCGKTRLALQVAGETLGTRHDEAWFVDLSVLADPGLVPAAVMAAMGVREVRDQSHTETLSTYLGERGALIALDNCEHVLAAAAALAEALVLGCGRLGILATSREPLGIAGEVVWRVPCLTVPEEQGPMDIESLDASDAVRLFTDRAREARPNFSITDDNAPAVAAVCQRLDGIPLAIELAAARVRMMSVEHIADALADRFHLLSDAGRHAIPRQATLRASVDWSYELLPEPERALVRRLSVFAGDFSLDAAEHVGAAGTLGRYDVLGLLSALVDKSLVQVDEEGARYRLLETIRAYAAEELAGAAEDVAARDRHLSFFTELSERAEKGMWTSALQWWLVVLDAEHDNLRAAVDWSLASGQEDTGARLVCGIGQFLFVRCVRSEGQHQCEELLGRDVAPVRRAELYYWAACFAQFSDPAASLAYGKALVALGRELGDDKAVARGLGQVGRAQTWSDPLTALGTFGEALATARAAGDPITVVNCLCWSAGANFHLGRVRETLRCGEEALATAQSIGYTRATASALQTVAYGAQHCGELDRAADANDALTELAESLGDKYFMQCAHRTRGVLGMYRAEPSAAEALAAARELAVRTHDDLNLVAILCDQGALALALGQDDQARRALEDVLPQADRVQPVYAARNRCLLAEAAVRRGDLAEALHWLDRARASPLAELFHTTRAQARLARAKGDHHRAWELADGGLESARGSGARLLVVDFLELLALVVAGTGKYVEAGRLLASASTERERLGYVRFPVDQPDVEMGMVQIEAALGPTGLGAAWSEGASLSVDEAVEYARRRRGERGRPSAGWASLTPTELKVVKLVVEGLTNAEIGGRLFVSTGTVKSHLNHIFDKLELTNRRQLVGAARAMMVSM